MTVKETAKTPPRSFTSALNSIELHKLSAIAFQFEDSRFRDEIFCPITVAVNGEPCALFVEFVPEDRSIDRELRPGYRFLARRPDFWTALIIEQPRHAYLSRGQIPVGSATKWPHQIMTAIDSGARAIEELLNAFEEHEKELWDAGVVYTPEAWRDIEPIWRDTFDASVCDAFTDIVSYIHENLSAPGSLDPRMRIDLSSL